MDGIDAGLAAYYDQEASIRLRRAIDPQRVQRRDEFVDLLAAENRRTLLEVGAGPGRDSIAFADAGRAPVGIDLSIEHVRLAVADGLAAAQASLYSLPFAAGRFEAGWTMSTLVHVPDSRFDEAMSSIIATLQRGAPLAAGMWGGFDQEGPSGFDEIQPPRFFSLRSHGRAREMLSRHGQLERFETWSHGTSTWEYQYAIIRVGIAAP